jgi:methionyl-tRNA formyltransferase
MRIAFMGTPDFSVPTLDALIEAGHEVVAVYTQPPRRAGRGKALAPSPVHRRADAARIDVMAPATLRDPAAQAAFAALDLDVAVVAAYGLILPEPVLAAPRHGCLNVHASLLPRWRGAAPIQRAILAGDERTGVCIMGMEKGLDTGPVYARRETDVDRKTAGELTAELAGIGGALMVEVLDRIGEIAPEPQPDEGVTYAAKIEKAEAKLDFSRPADEVERQIRAFNPAPGAYFEYRGERVRILAADLRSRESGRPEGLDPRFRGGAVIDDGLTISCGTDAIRPTLVQRAGRAAMTPGELLRGFSIPPGAVL